MPQVIVKFFPWVITQYHSNVKNMTPKVMWRVHQYFTKKMALTGLYRRFFLQGEAWWERGNNFWSGFRVLRDSNHKFYINSYLTSYLHADWKIMYRFLFVTHAFSVFCFIKRLFNSGLILLRRKVCKSSYNWVLKYLKSAIFLSLLSWMRRRKGEVTRKVLQEWWFDL